jgi:hypothetical protein
MKNVVKGFEVSKMAVPKAQASSINKSFQTYHKIPNIKLPRPQEPKPAKTVKPMGVTRRGVKGL